MSESEGDFSCIASRRCGTVRAKSTVRHVYDELGRLTAAIAQRGDAAVYQYDAVGNLLSIARHTNGSGGRFSSRPETMPCPRVRRRNPGVVRINPQQLRMD